MIHAKLYQKQRGSIHLLVLGHAGAAPRGHDPICAGVSALVHTAAQAVHSMYRSGMLRCRPRIILEDGYAVVIATPRREFDGEVLLTFWVVQTGLAVIAANFPRFLQLEPLKAAAGQAAPDH